MQKYERLLPSEAVLVRSLLLGAEFVDGGISLAGEWVFPTTFYQPG